MQMQNASTEELKMLPKLIDIGANLTHSSFDQDICQVITDAQAAGVERIMVTSCNLIDTEKAVQLCTKYPNLTTTCGIHPHHAASWHQESADQIIQLAQKYTCIKALGEMGLDFFRDLCPRLQQEQAFVGQLEVATQLQLPIFLHEREAFLRFYQILTEFRPQLSQVVVHCFTGDQRALTAYLELDCYIGITGWICDERRGQHLIDLLKFIPLDRLMIETDAPYLLPRNLPSNTVLREARRNEPRLLQHIAGVIAQHLAIPLETLSENTYLNSRRFFNLDETLNRE